MHRLLKKRMLILHPSWLNMRHGMRPFRTDGLRRCRPSNDCRFSFHSATQRQIGILTFVSMPRPRCIFSIGTKNRLPTNTSVFAVMTFISCSIHHAFRNHLVRCLIFWPSGIFRPLRKHSLCGGIACPKMSQYRGTIISSLRL